MLSQDGLFAKKFSNIVVLFERMFASKEDTIARLQREILSLQGYRLAPLLDREYYGLGPIRHAFPNSCFPTGAIHECICNTAEDISSTSAFVTGILGQLMKDGAACLWISSSGIIFPHALKSFGLEPDRVVFVNCTKQKDIQWVMEEALKCEGLAAVVGETYDFSFTASRRLQLAVEQSRVTGFVIRKKPKILNTTASVARWKITSLPSIAQDEMPGIGFPRWNVQLLKVRNGKTGSWDVEWKDNRFRHVTRLTSIEHHEPKRKTG